MDTARSCSEDSGLADLFEEGKVSFCFFFGYFAACNIIGTVLEVTKTVASSVPSWTYFTLFIPVNPFFEDFLVFEKAPLLAFFHLEILLLTVVDDMDSLVI